MNERTYNVILNVVLGIAIALGVAALILWMVAIWITDERLSDRLEATGLLLLGTGVISGIISGILKSFY